MKRKLIGNYFMQCAICKNESPRYDGWSKSSYDIDEVCISYETDSLTNRAIRYDVDICPWCFITRVVPWLESQGAQIRKTEIDRE
jgi:hypothetical protein